jgi:large subunit ribosomal protein L25
MKTIEIKGTTRKDLGKKATRDLRAGDQVPCVLYGGKEVVHFSALNEEFRNLVYSPNVYMVNLSVDGKKHEAILKNIQFNPVSDAIEHVDFLEIEGNKKVQFSIPVKLNGLAEGVKQGGKLTLKLRKIRVKGEPKHFPDTLDVDVTGLELGKTIKIQDLSFENLELCEAKNVVVATVKMTRNAAAAAAEAAKK